MTEEYKENDFIIGYDNRMRKDSRWTSDNCFKWGWNVIYPVSGHCRVFCNDEFVCDLKPDQITLFPPGMLRSYYVMEEWSAYWSHFVTRQNVQWSYNSKKYYQLFLKDHQTKERMIGDFTEAIQLYALRPHGWYTFAQALMENIILRGNLSEDQAEIPVELKIACKLLNDPTYQFRNMDILAKDCRLSRTNLYRLFQIHFGTTPNNYRENHILRESAFLLENTNMPLKEISTRGNFSDVHYFSRRFHLKYGMPPGDFRKKRRGK